MLIIFKYDKRLYIIKLNAGYIHNNEHYKLSLHTLSI
jgi:hypothetical protein